MRVFGFNTFFFLESSNYLASSKADPHRWRSPQTFSEMEKRYLYLWRIIGHINCLDDGILFIVINDVENVNVFHGMDVSTKLTSSAENHLAFISHPVAFRRLLTTDLCNR